MKFLFFVCMISLILGYSIQVDKLKKQIKKRDYQIGLLEVSDSILKDSLKDCGRRLESSYRTSQ